MAELPKDPTGYALEDLIAAHFVSRGCYVETGIKERNPDEVLELDLVWTDYRQEPQRGRPVEVKSGDWGLGDVFKFHGWTTYLGLRDALFVHKEPCGRISPSCLTHVAKGTGIQLLHVPTPADAEAHLEKMGLKKPHWDELPEVWRFSFWAQRRLLKALNAAVKHGVCPQSAKAAKEYHQLINDAVFFVPDPRDRVGELLSAHFGHQSLGLTAAQEIETGKVEFEDPAETKTFNRILYDGQYFPAQTCLYLAHRARLYVLKAVVDYWLGRERGDIKERTIKFGKMLIDLTSGRLSTAMARGAEELSEAKTFRLFPVFWQVFLWSWGGFLLKDRADQEFSDLERETGVARDEIPLALQTFDKLFPTAGGWFREPSSDQRKVLMLMPAAMRGIGAFRRLGRAGVKSYKDLGYKDYTTSRLGMDHNTGARLLDCADTDLVK